MSLKPRVKLHYALSILSIIISLLSLAIAVSTLTAYLTKKTNAISEEVIKCLPQFKLLGTTVLFFAMAVAFGVVATQFSEAYKLRVAQYTTDIIKQNEKQKSRVSCGLPTEFLKEDNKVDTLYSKEGEKIWTALGVFVPPILVAVSAVNLHKGGKMVSLAEDTTNSILEPILGKPY